MFPVSYTHLNIVISDKTVRSISGDVAVYQMLNGTEHRD